MLNKKSFIIYLLNIIGTVMTHFFSAPALLPSERLLRAIADNDLNGVMGSIKDKANVNFERSDLSPLFLSVSKGFFPIATYLVEQGANINCKNRRGWRVMHEAVLKNNVDFVNFLSKSGGLLLQPRDNDGWTPLRVAVEHSHVDMAYALLVLKSSNDLEDQDGLTPLMIACKKGDQSMVETLIRFPVDFKKTNSSNQTILEQAESYPFPAITALISAEMMKQNISVKLEKSSIPSINAAHAEPAISQNPNGERPTSSKLSGIKKRGSSI